jgi:hypothetical protein
MAVFRLPRQVEQVKVEYTWSTRLLRRCGHGEREAKGDGNAAKGAHEIGH